MKDKKYWLHPHSRPFIHRRKKGQHYYEPFYDAHSDYNTNAPSYYDYLARFNSNPRIIIDLINRLLRRDILLKNTNSIDFTKIGSWIEDECDNFDDEITIKAHVNRSKYIQEWLFPNFSPNGQVIKNAIEEKQDGLYVADIVPFLTDIDIEFGRVNKRIDDLDVRVTKNENDIKNIYKEINNINKRIDAMMGINSIRLTKGKDYELNFFNGFYSIEGDFNVRVIETDSTLEFLITTSHPNGFSLANDNLTKNTLMRHSNTISDVPESRVFEIELKGEYAKYNGKRVLISQTSNNLWNLNPRNERASWNASLPVTSMSYGNYLFSWASFSDGYNTQLTRYNEELSMDRGNLNIKFTIEK